MGKYKIIHNDTEFDASSYQEEIFDFIKTGTGNLVVAALAGSAKTATLVNSVRFIPEDKKIMIVAFNKHIAEEANRKINSKNVTARTCSSVGYEICRENGVGTGEVNDDKYDNYIRNNINSLSQYGEIDSISVNERWHYIKTIRQLVDLCRYTLAFTEKEIQALAEKYGIMPIRDEIAVCRKVLIWGKDNTDVIDETDMVWLPSVLNLQTKYLLKDFIFIDESQDISLAQQAIIMKCAKRGCRFVAVGDRNQQINVWCGSDEEAIEKFKEMPNTVTKDLPICYRCAKQIIKFANDYSEDKMIPAPWAIEGEIRYDVPISSIHQGDMVLSRNTAPLIELQQILLKRNQKVYIQGFKKIREEYEAMISDFLDKDIDIKCHHEDGLFYNLYMSLINEIERLTEGGMSEEEALSHPSVLSKYDNIQALKVISEGLDTVQELADKIRMIFSGDESNAILLSTVHRAKGLEADRVFIYKPSILQNNHLAKKAWEIKTERNLQYVAYTRAKKQLNFIEEEKDYWKKNPYASSSNMKAEIMAIKYGILHKVQWDKHEVSAPLINKHFILKTEGSAEMVQTIPTQEKKKKGGMKLLDLN